MGKEKKASKAKDTRVDGPQKNAIGNAEGFKSRGHSRVAFTRRAYASAPR
jgi:hypothetical protein